MCVKTCMQFFRCIGMCDTCVRVGDKCMKKIATVE